MKGEVRQLFLLLETTGTDFKGVEELFKEVLKHEEFVTASINEIVGLTLDEKDFNTHNFLQWFVMNRLKKKLQSGNSGQS